MNKLYNSRGRLIGYNRNFNTADTYKLFAEECNTIKLKLDVLGFAESGRSSYYMSLINKYGLQGLELRHGKMYFKGTDVEWRYKPSDCTSMFSYVDCDYIDFSSLDTRNTTIMRGMLSNALLQKLEFSKIDTHNVIDMKAMFMDSVIDSLDLSAIDTSKVTTMNEMFSGSVIGKLDASSFNTKNVNDMSMMFFECNIKELDISSFSIGKATDFSLMFSCSILEHIKINKDTYNLFYTTYKSDKDSNLWIERILRVCEIV